VLEHALDDLHRMEEALVAAAIAAGQPVHRSPSAPPAAVLGVTISGQSLARRLMSRLSGRGGSAPRKPSSSPPASYARLDARLGSCWA
jgi:hypothetical protein